MASNAVRAEETSIASLTVFADSRLSVPLSKLASLFTQKEKVGVTNAFGASDQQQKDIDHGEAADVFITAEPQLIQQLRARGALDTSYPVSEIVAQNATHYSVAVLRGENVKNARAYVAYLKSTPSRALFTRHGMSAR